MTDEMVDELIAKYHKIIPDATPSDILIAITSDRLRMSSVRVAERKSTGSPAPVYMYLFTWESPFVGGILKSCHTLEIPFVFNNVEPTIGILGDSPGRIRLAENMSRAWVSFARDGNPNHGGIPFWPTYSAEKRSTMLFDIECSVEDDPRGKERLAWEGQ
jgi:para-nitrobenzyl esterase